jgi:5S rRNA maturation endonuclease (ribonuclease M5)
MAQLDDLFGEIVTPEIRAQIEQHLSGCEHCLITMNTTRKTIEIYNKQELYPLPEELRTRMEQAILSKCRKC